MNSSCEEIMDILFSRSCLHIRSLSFLVRMVDALSKMPEPEKRTNMALSLASPLTRASSPQVLAGGVARACSSPAGGLQVL